MTDILKVLGINPNKALIIIGEDLAKDLNNKRGDQRRQAPQRQEKSNKQINSKEKLVKTFQQSQKKPADPGVSNAIDMIDGLVESKKIHVDTANLVISLLEKNDGGRSFRKEVIKKYKEASKEEIVEKDDDIEIFLEGQDFDLIESGKQVLENLKAEGKRIMKID